MGGHEGVMEARGDVKSVGQAQKESFVFYLPAYSTVGDSNFEAI